MRVESEGTKGVRKNGRENEKAREERKRRRGR